jgi:hypothetical protein
MHGSDDTHLRSDNRNKARVNNNFFTTENNMTYCTIRDLKKVDAGKCDYGVNVVFYVPEVDLFSELD